MKEPIRYERLDKICPSSVFEQLARIHKEEIDQGFLSTLGTGFLQRLYRALASSPHAFVIAALNKDEVAGFICGSTDTRKVYRGYLIRWGLLSVPFLLPKVLSLRRMHKVVETVLYPTRKESRALPSSEILNFCVATSWQRNGIGRRLFAQLLNEFGRRGVESIKMVTGENQEKAQRFYEASNASKAGEICVHDETRSIVYVYDIPRAS